MIQYFFSPFKKVKNIKTFHQLLSRFLMEVVPLSQADANFYKTQFSYYKANIYNLIQKQQT